MRQLLTDLRGNPIYFSSRRRQRRYRHPNLPPLFYQVQNRSWDDAVRRARSHPHEVTIQEDATGNTPLHMACRLDPPAEVVRALLESSRTTNAEGATALHVAATHRCSAVVIRVLLEDDDATSCLTRAGRAPIHYACMSFRGLGVEAFQLLLEETLQKGNVVIQESSNEFDLIDEDDIAKDDLSTDTVSTMVNVMTMRDCKGQTPLGLLFRRYRERVRCVIKTVEKLRTEHDGTVASIAAAITVQADLGELWQKARIIVGRLTEERLQREGIIGDEELAQSPGEEAIAQDAAAWAAERHRRSLRATHPNDSAPVVERQFRIVHASVGLTGYGCPPELIRLAISIHPQQVQEMDEDGNLPLHIAAVASSYISNSNTGELHMASTAPAADEESSVSDLSFLSCSTALKTNAFDTVIRILLGHYPAAARIPHGRTGRLPFVMAIEARRRTWEDGIKTLLDAFPPALESRRIPMDVYPHILSLIGNRDNVIVGFPKISAVSGKRRRQGLTTLFELVKAKPDLVRLYGRAHDEARNAPL